ncbi:hypothetical protein M3Y95_00367400 [Aphelenchoides besseyi]|nr:hypothetical protein M3Y95_00367400 [Aphelenchoides besseyi]
MNNLVDEYAHQLFDNNNSVKVCAHLRRGDFVTRHSQLPTEDLFLIPAMKYLIQSSTDNQKISDVEVLLLSNDHKYADSAKEKIKKLNLTDKVYVARKLNRIENLNLASRHCDYMLLSASGSTFGWSMAYLMPDEKQNNVYYNSQVFKPTHQKLAATVHEEDFFPAEWNRLVLNKENTTVLVESLQNI